MSAVTKRVNRPPPPGICPEMLLTHCPLSFSRLPAISGLEGVTWAKAEGRATFAVTAWNAASVDCTEIQRPESVGAKALGSPK